MKHSGILHSRLTQINGSNETVLIQPSALIPVLPLGYNYTYRIRFDLEMEYNLRQSLSISVVPPINPEDSKYRKYAKWLTATNGAEKILMQIKSRKQQATLREIELLNFGGTWREVISEGQYVDHDDILVVQLQSQGYGLPLGNDYVTLTGNYEIEIDAIQQTQLTTPPQNFGKVIGGVEPELIRAANLNRARLHLYNAGNTTVSIGFGSKQACEIGECLELEPRATWNDEIINKAMITSSVWGKAHGIQSSSTIVGLEVDWI